MYKFLSIVLAVVVLVVGIFFFLEKRSHRNTRKKLTNQIAELEGTLQETESSISRRAVQVEDLKSKNEELQNIIDDRDESILALTETNLKLRDKYFKIKNAKQTVVEENGQERVKVEFDHKEDPIEVSGFTLTNPAYAEVKLKWLRELQLSLILTKNDDDSFRVYLDSKSSDVVPTELQLSVDPSLLEYKWYEKIGLTGGISVGPGVQTNVGVVYDIDKNWFVGPHILWQYDGKEFRRFYGANAGWYPFR